MSARTIRLLPFEAIVFPGQYIQLSVPDDATENLLNEAAADNGEFGILNLSVALQSLQSREPVVGVLVSIKTVLAARNRISRMTVLAVATRRFVLEPSDGFTLDGLPLGAGRQDEDGADNVRLWTRLTGPGRNYLVARARPYEDAPIVYQEQLPPDDLAAEDPSARRHHTEEEAMRIFSECFMVAHNFCKKHEENSMWKHTIRRIGQPSASDFQSLSMWFCAAIPNQANSYQTIRQLFLTRNTIQRLQSACNLFKSVPPIRSTVLKEKTARQLKSGLVKTIRELSADPLDRPAAAVVSDGFQPPSLASLCIKTVAHSIDTFLSVLEFLPDEVLDQLAMYLADFGLMSKPVFVALRHSYIRSLSLIDTPSLDDSWFLDAFASGGTHSLELDSAKPFFPNLEVLDLSHNYRLTNAGLEQLLLHVPSLRELHLDRCKRIGTAAFANAISGCKNLRVLSVGGTMLSSKAVEFIATHCPSLVELDISGINSADEADAAAFALMHGAPTLGPSVARNSLRTLLLSCTKISQYGCLSLAALSQLECLSLSFNSQIHQWDFLRSFSNIRDLDLSLNANVDDATVQIISETMPHIEYLTLSRTEIGDSSGVFLESLSQLKLLDISRTYVTDGVAFAFASMPNLVSLSLAYTAVTPNFIPFLTKCLRLRQLKLSGCDMFGDAGVAALSSNSELCHLTSLDLGSSHLTDRSVPLFHAFGKLQSLQLWHTGLTQLGAATLATVVKLKLDTQMKTNKGTWLYVAAK